MNGDPDQNGSEPAPGDPGNPVPEPDPPPAEGDE